MTLREYLLEAIGDKDELARRLVNLDSVLETLHNHGLAIYNFSVDKIYLNDGMISTSSFHGLTDYIGMYPNMKENNIIQAAKIGMFAYNNMPLDASVDQQMFTFISQNIKLLNRDGIVIPEEIYEYYEEIFINGNFDYLNNFLVKKQQLLSGNANSNSIRKNLSTPYGRALNPDNESAFINILYIPSIITLLYLIILVGYMILK